MEYGAYKIYRSKVYDSNSTKTKTVKMEVNCHKVHMLSLEKICCHLKRECDNFKIYTIIPKAFTKITEQRVMTNKLSY